MLRRAIGLVVSVTLAIPVVVIASGLPPFAAQRAHAQGFNFLCQAPGGGGGGDSEFSLLATGLATKIVTDQALWITRITVPAGVPVTAPGAVTDPVTHATTFTMPIAPKLGNSQKLDFIPASYPGGAGDEIRMGYAFRNKAGQRADDLSMKEMFTENFGLPPSGGDIDVAGVDIDIQTNAAIGNMQGFDATFGAFYSYQLANGSTNFAAGRFNINSKRPGARIPEDATLSLAQAKPTGSTASYVAFGQRAIQAEYTGAANQPGVGFGVALDRVIAGAGGQLTSDPFLSMDLDWSAAPRGVAVGVGSLCPDKAQIAWNHSGLPSPAAASVGIDVKYGIEEGQQIQLPGPVDKFADITDVQGTITGLPAQMDVILLRDALSFTRSNDVAPDLDLTRLSMADDDPAQTGNLPLFATAHATHIPRHVLVTAEENPTTGAFTRAELTSWTLNCPGETVPPGSAAPDTLRRLDLPATLPSFPAGCVRWNLTPIPSMQLVVQNWLPEDLRGQDAAAGLATAPLPANQFAYFATRSHHALSNEPLRAFGAEINGVKRATVDMTAPPAGGTGVRLYVERGGITATDDSMQLVGDVDLRDSASDALNTGIRVSSAATITDLPDTMRVDYSNTPTQPFRFTWRADAGIALANGVFDVLLPAPTALVVHGAFETGAVGAGALPPAADLLVAVSADQTTRAFLWSKPAAPTDTFPTAVVPAFDPSTITRVHAGAEISTLEQRNAGSAIRAHADIDVPQPVLVAWVTKADGTISSATGAFCSPTQPAGCAATKLDATVAIGPRGDLSPAALLTPPALPGPDGTIQNTVPAFTDFRPDSGARAVVFSATSWGVDLLVRGIARVSYNASPQNVEVQMANTSPQPFRAEVLDASRIVHASNGFDRPQVLFADTLIDRLPQQIRVSLDDSPTGDQPMVWVNTENLAITDVDTVDFDATDTPGTRPVISGVVRAGDAQILALGVNASARPTDPRTAAKKGIDLFGGFDVDRGFFGIDASFALDLPRHVAVWRPTSTDCSEAEDPPVALDVCRNQNKRSYEIDRTHTIDLKFKTTSQALGDMELNGFLGGTNLNDGFHGTIGNVPGLLTGSVLIAKNARLPWTTLDASITGNAPLQTVAIEVFDHLDPTSYESDNGNQPTSKFGLLLTNVPKELGVKTRVLGVEDRITDGPPSPPDDPCKADPTVKEELGYVHAQMDLAAADVAGKAALEFDVRQIDGQATAKLTSNEPVTGFVNARVDHLSIKAGSECHATTGQRILAGAIGLGIAGVGALAGLGIGAAIGSGGGPVGAAIGAVVGLIVAFFLDLFTDPTVTLELELEADLPFFVAFDKVKEMAFGLNSLTISAHQDQPAGGEPLQVGFRQQALANEDPFSVDGAWFWNRHTSYVGDDIPAQSDWDIGNDIGTATVPSQIGTVGVYDYDLCKDADSDDPCYEPGNDNVSTVSDADGAFVIDPFFSPENRDDLEDNEGGESVSPGSELWGRVAKQGDPMLGADFDFSDLTNTTAESASFSLQTNCCAEASVVVQGTVVNLGNRGAVCEYPSPADLLSQPVARGTDGTEYVVAAGGTTDAVTNEQERSLCSSTSYVLSAHLPRVATDRLGPTRWSVALPTPAALEVNGECQQHGVRCELSFTVNPQADGSVRVSETTTVITNGVDESSLEYLITDPNIGNLVVNLSRKCCGAPDIEDGDTPTDGGSTHAMVDASGVPGFWQSHDTAVDDFAATTSGIAPVVGSPGKFALDPCAIASFACGELADGEQLVWLFGDGDKATVVGVPAVQTHVYPTFSSPQSYFGELLLLGPNCSDDDTRVCNLEQKAMFTLTN